MAQKFAMILVSGSTVMLYIHQMKYAQTIKIMTVMERQIMMILMIVLKSHAVVVRIMRSVLMVSVNRRLKKIHARHAAIVVWDVMILARRQAERPVFATKLA
jgi:hypothetical protein